MSQPNKPGVKFDNGKPSMALLPTYPLTQVARVLDFGAKKYTADNWRGGMEWRRLISASLRHMFAFSDGEDFDQETGISHLAHAACCILFLLEYTQTHGDKDDRFKRTGNTSPEGTMPATKSSDSSNGAGCGPLKTGSDCCRR